MHYSDTVNLSAEKAREYLKDAENMNNGAWIAHSYYTGIAAGILAMHMPGLDQDKARAYGFIHDIGRRFGEMKIDHIFKGYYFLLDEGYSEAAEICLTHSFPVQNVQSVTNIWDCSNENYCFLEKYLSEKKYSLYDILIQFCDNIATAEGVVILEKRLIDIVRRYGVDDDNTILRWEKLFLLKKEIEYHMKNSIENVLNLKSVNDFNLRW